MKCFWKTLKLLHGWDINSIDLDAVLLKIHYFYKAYPNSYWKKNSEMSDTPYRLVHKISVLETSGKPTQNIILITHFNCNRTVKTLVHALVKKKGLSISDHLTLIPDAQGSDLYLYLLKVFKVSFVLN